MIHKSTNRIRVKAGNGSWFHRCVFTQVDSKKEGLILKKNNMKKFESLGEYHARYCDVVECKCGETMIIENIGAL